MTKTDTTANGNTLSVARVELYNIWEGLNGQRLRAPANGWLVARYVNGRREQTLKRFGRDEAAARRYAELWNGYPG